MILYTGIRDISDFIMIEIITTSVFVLSSIYGGATMTTDNNVNLTATTSNDYPIVAVEQATTSIPTSKELEKKAKAYFKNDPILVDIARCESRFRQVDKNGNVLRGDINKGDLGLMQINEYYHADAAKTLGLDLKTVDGNMAYAKYLYDREGGQPWISSSKCWNQTANTKSGNQVAVNR